MYICSFLLFGTSVVVLGIGLKTCIPLLCPKQNHVGICNVVKKNKNDYDFREHVYYQQHVNRELKNL